MCLGLQEREPSSGPRHVCGRLLSDFPPSLVDSKVEAAAAAAGRGDVGLGFVGWESGSIKVWTAG